jgi:hypothetical protein
MSTESDITRISGRIFDVYSPLAVGTFGSYAIGSPHEKSDLDLFVIKRISQCPEATEADRQGASQDRFRASVQCSGLADC